MAEPKENEKTTKATTSKKDEVVDTSSSVQKKTSENIDELKAISALSYLGILFFIPMVTNPKSEFAMYHANQGLLLLIAVMAINTVGSIIPFIGWFLILPLGNIFVFVLFVMGVINALGGAMKPLPLIGGFELIKVQK
jgi:uncharacterized membrane protein